MSGEYEYFEQIRIEGVIFSVNEEYGALVVYCKERHRGNHVWVSPGGFSANVVERTVNEKPTYAAVFPHLRSGQYQVKMTSEYDAYISVFPGHIAEVDWR